VLDLIRIDPFSPEWTLPSQLDDSPLPWMLEVQREACAKGLIPCVPALRDRALR
jgi:hypothetical protein